MKLKGVFIFLVIGFLLNIGLATAQTTFDYTVSDNFERTSLGSNWQIMPNTGFIDGTIDDVKIYNRALSASEVSALYSTGS